MSNTAKEGLPVIKQSFKKGGLKTFIVNKIKEVNTEVPETFNWSDFDITLRTYFGDESYLSDKKTEFVIRLKEDEAIQQKYKRIRIKLPDENIVFTMNSFYLNDILDNYGFNKSFDAEDKDAVKQLIQTVVGDVVEFEEETTNNQIHLYVKMKQTTESNQKYSYTLVDTDSEEKRNDDFSIAYHYSSLLSVKVNNNGQHGYTIHFNVKENEATSGPNASEIITPPPPPHGDIGRAPETIPDVGDDEEWGED